MNTVVSKTDFLLWRECPKNAWLKIHKPDIYYAAELSDFEKSIIETGNEVETEARKLFPTGVLIEGRNEASQEKTRELITSKEKTLFQPIFVKNGFLAAVDLLKFDEKTSQYSIYEIKASNQIKEKTHLYDLAFQVNLLKKAGINVGAINLLHLNPEYVRSGELDIIKLFSIDDVTDQVTDFLESVEREMAQALAYLSETKEPSGFCSCVYKGRSSHCTTFSYSNPQIPEYSVHDIARIGVSKAKLTELIDGSIFRLDDIAESIELSEIQQNQVNAHISGRPLIKNDRIAEEFRSLQFPLYFLDYETFPSAIPRFDGFSPYQQIPFQYSLHSIESPGAEPKHVEFLHTEANDPSPAFIESLQKNIGRIGTVIVWNKKFECKINEELEKRLRGQTSESPALRSDLGDFIAELNSRVYDLMDIFSKQYYVHKDFHGSTSIKYVLPVLVPELNYKNLEIQEGGTATLRWNELVTGKLTGDEKEKLAKDLREYCKLDTFAMYKIWEKLQEIVD